MLTSIRHLHIVPIDFKHSPMNIKLAKPPSPCLVCSYICLTCVLCTGTCIVKTLGEYSSSPQYHSVCYVQCQEWTCSENTGEYSSSPLFSVAISNLPTTIVLYCVNNAHLHVHAMKTLGKRKPSDILPNFPKPGELKRSCTSELAAKHALRGKFLPTLFLSLPFFLLLVSIVNEEIK